MQAGHLALLNYGEVPTTWHTRILLANTTGNHWLILTPDHDRYEQEMSRGNPDLIDFEHLGPTGNFPPRIRANTFYGFADIAPGELARQMALAQRCSSRSSPGSSCSGVCVGGH